MTKPIRMLEIGLRDSQEWGSADTASWHQRHSAAELRNNVLAVFAKLDPQKVIALQKEFQTAAKSTSANSPEISLKRQDWHKSFSDQRAIADQSAKIALQLIDTDPEKAFKLIVQSLQGGTVSSVLFHIVQKLIGSGNRAFLNKIQMGIGQALTANLTLDPFSLS